MARFSLRVCFGLMNIDTIKSKKYFRPNSQKYLFALNQIAF